MTGLRRRPSQVFSLALVGARRSTALAMKSDGAGRPSQADHASGARNMNAVSATDRVLPLAGIHNFRDYGGYGSSSGRLKRGLLFRSAQHHGATPADLDAVAALRLSTVIDLRGAKERALAPCPRPQDFSAQVFFVDEDTTGLAPHVQAASNSPDPAAAAAGMLTGYAQMPFRPRMIPILHRYFEALATIDGPSLIHCMAGKDRTGLAVALFHEAMGVNRDDIIADYMLTNVAGRLEDRIAAGAAHISAAYGDATSEETLRVLMSVRPEYLEAAFAAIEQRHGAVSAYLRDVLGVDDRRRDAIRSRVVA